MHVPLVRFARMDGQPGYRIDATLIDAVAATNHPEWVGVTP